MKIRAAIMATLINFVVCALLLTVCSATASNLQNEIIEEECKLTCRLSTEMLDSAAFQDDPGEYLSGIAEEGGMLVAYFRSDKSVAYQSFSYDAVLPTEKEWAEDTTGGACAFRRTNAEGTKLICASMSLSDGSVLCYGKAARGWTQSLGDYLWVFVLIIAANLVAQFVIIYRTVGLSDTLLDSVMKVMEDFTEGNFESRIPAVSVASMRVAAQYNATLARVQDRVFRQQRRNRVVGQMLNQMRNGLITVNREMCVSFVASSTGELFGMPLNDVEGSSLSSIFQNEELEKLFQEAMNSGTGNVCTGSVDGKRPDGGNRPLRVYASAMYHEGKCTGAMAVIEDVTEIRKLEQLRTDFAANVSHEMKTPLTSIKGFVETLQAGAVDNPEMARKFLDIIMLEADRLTRLINDILSITKLESGEEHVEIKRIALDRAVMEVCDLLRIHASEKEVQLIAKPNPEPTYVMGNPDRVKQLLINLIENGIKYNKTGGNVTVKVMEDNGGNVNLIIADTGIGIKEEHLPRLFERFYRVDKGRSRAMGGTGLGLAIVKHIVKTMDGLIEVNSKYGEGTEFLITLPAAPEEIAEETAEETSEEIEGEITEETTEETTTEE